jgi:predicted transcriptional regulator
MKICEMMHKGVIFCYPEDNLRDVAKIMHHNQIRSVAVVDESGEVWGVISIMELLPYCGEDLEHIKAESIMRPYKIDINPLASIEEAVEIMKKRKIEHLIIVDPHAGPKRPVGIFTSYDMVQYMSGLNTGCYEYQLKMHSDK